MIQASEAWIAAHEQNILPETFVEISLGIIDEAAQSSLSASAGDEEIFSTVDNVAVPNAQARYYATLERNLWALDGTRTVYDPSVGRQNIGYVSEGGRNGTVQISFRNPVVTLLPGITVTWSSEYNEYPKSYTVTARNGSQVVASETVTNNTSVTSTVLVDLSGYDSITIETHDWCKPDRRARVDGVTVGIGSTFTKEDLISFTHESEGDLCSGMLPKNSVTFSLDNSTGRWNPDNPQGSTQYLAERMPLKVRYGMKVNDAVEWIEAGTFYLSEWDAPAGGMEATFTARDIFDYLLNTPYPETSEADLDSIVKSAFRLEGIPDDLVLYTSATLQRISAPVAAGYNAAEVVQMCANSVGHIMKIDRLGQVHVTPLTKESSGFTIRQSVSLSQPEVKLSKPIRAITCSVGDPPQTYVWNLSTTGETQTITNPMIVDTQQAAWSVQAAYMALDTRKSVSGEFRADPRLDVYDIVKVESKYGDIYPVALTSIKYRYNGSFWATYEGRVLPSGVMED